LREALLLYKDTSPQIEDIMSNLEDHDNKILVIFEYLKQFEQSKQEETDF